MSASQFLGPEFTREAGVESSGSTREIASAQRSLSLERFSEAGPFESGLIRTINTQRAESVGIPMDDIERTRADPLRAHEAETRIADPSIPLFNIDTSGLPGFGAVSGAAGLIAGAIVLLASVWIFGQLFTVVLGGSSS